MSDGLQAVCAVGAHGESGDDAADIVSACDAIIETHADLQNPEAMRQVARALLRKGEALSRSGLRQQEIEAYEDLSQRFARTGDALLVEAVAMAHNRRGKALIEIDQIDEAFRAFDIAWATVTGWKQPRLARQAANALYATGVLRWRQGQVREAISAWADLTRQFGDMDDAEVAARLAAAGESQITLLMRADRSSEAIRACNDVVTRFGSRTQPVFVLAVGFALVSKAECLVEAGRFEDAVETCDQAIGLGADADERTLARWSAKAALIRGRALLALGRDREAAIALRDINRTFRHHADVLIAGHVANALVELADLLTTTGLPEKAVTLCEEVIRRYGEHPAAEFTAIVNQARYQRACAFAAMKDAGSALTALKDWVGQSGGLDIGAVQTDTDFDTVRSDPAFADYLDRALSA